MQLIIIVIPGTYLSSWPPTGLFHGISGNTYTNSKLHMNKLMSIYTYILEPGTVHHLYLGTKWSSAISRRVVSDIRTRNDLITLAWFFPDMNILGVAMVLSTASGFSGYYRPIDIYSLDLPHVGQRQPLKEGPRWSDLKKCFEQQKNIDVRICRKILEEVVGLGLSRGLRMSGFWVKLKLAWCCADSFFALATWKTP